jgi:hypothetical protein
MFPVNRELLMTGSSSVQGLGGRIMAARVQLALSSGHKVTQAGLGALVSQALGREQAITGATVSRWEAGQSVPDLESVAGIAAVCKVDPGWLAFGPSSGAPAPDELAGMGHLAAIAKVASDPDGRFFRAEQEQLFRSTAQLDQEREAQLREDLRALEGRKGGAARQERERIRKALEEPSLTDGLRRAIGYLMSTPRDNEAGMRGTKTGGVSTSRRRKKA